MRPTRCACCSLLSLVLLVLLLCQRPLHRVCRCCVLQPVKLELEKLESRLKGRKQREQDTYRRMFNASPPAAAPPNEKHAKRGAGQKTGSVFGGVRTHTILVQYDYSRFCSL